MPFPTRDGKYVRRLFCTKCNAQTEMLDANLVTVPDRDHWPQGWQCDRGKHRTGWPDDVEGICPHCRGISNPPKDEPAPQRRKRRMLKKLLIPVILAAIPWVGHTAWTSLPPKKVTQHRIDGWESCRGLNGDHLYAVSFSFRNPKTDEVGEVKIAPAHGHYRWFADLPPDATPYVTWTTQNYSCGYAYDVVIHAHKGSSPRGTPTPAK